MKRTVDINCMFDWLGNFWKWTTLIGLFEFNITLWNIADSL